MDSWNFALHALPEGRSYFAKGSENYIYLEQKTPTPKKFIADSSPIGNHVGMHAHPCALREVQPRREAGGQSLGASS